jgi:hypothetical protein
VENGDGFAFTATGERLTLGVYGDAVIVLDRQADPHGPEIVHRWLSAHAAAVLEARRAKARKGGLTLSTLEEMGLLPTAIEALIGYSASMTNVRKPPSPADRSWVRRSAGG